MRYWYGQSPADWTMTIGSGGAVLVSPGVPCTAWSAPSGGVQYTDLLDASGSPITVVTSSDGIGALPAGLVPRFQADDGVAVLWLDAGAGVRYELRGDLSGMIGELASLASDVENALTTVDALATVASTGEYEDLIGAPTLAEVATTGDYDDLSGAPAPGLQYVVKVGATWPLRSTSAPEAGRPAMWIGPEPAPAAGGGYALEGDVWVAT